MTGLDTQAQQADPAPPSPDAVGQAVRRLLDAQATRTPCAPVRDLIAPTDVVGAYAVQAEVASIRRAAGGVVVGRKIGLTSPAVQQQLGVDRPDFGVLFADMDVSGATVPMDRLLQPKVEAEIAFVLGADLAEGLLDLEQVTAAVQHAAPALEIVDSRIAGWDITFADTVADNGSSALFVLGEERVSLVDYRPVDSIMEMQLDGEVVSTGTGAACLGNPLEALAWLARTARDLGDPLTAGQVILSGALGPMVPVTPEATVHAAISGLGTVSATFSSPSQESS